MVSEESAFVCRSLSEGSEADLALGEPRQLDRRRGHRLLTRQVDGRLPVFECKVSVNLKVLADALHGLDVEIVQRGAALDQLVSPVNTGGTPASLVDFTGTDAKTGKPARLVGVMLPLAGQTWFYKLMGDESVVARQKDAFIKFIQSARYPDVN